MVFAANEHDIELRNASNKARKGFRLFASNIKCDVDLIENIIFIFVEAFIFRF
jgi:hypothetical protein